MTQAQLAQVQAAVGIHATGQEVSLWGCLHSSSLRGIALQLDPAHARTYIQRGPSPLAHPPPLPQTINEKPQVIQEYESGKAIPNPQVLSKLSRILGVQLKK